MRVYLFILYDVSLEEKSTIDCFDVFDIFIKLIICLYVIQKTKYYLKYK